MDELEILFIALGFCMTVLSAIGAGVGTFYAGRRGLTDDAIKMYEAVDKDNIRLSAKIDSLEEDLKEQKKRTDSLEFEVENLSRDKTNLENEVKQSNAKIDKLVIENIELREKQKRLSARFVAVRDLLIETHRVALVLVDQLINEEDKEPKEYPPQIEGIIKWELGED